MQEYLLDNLSSVLTIVTILIGIVAVIVNIIQTRITHKQYKVQINGIQNQLDRIENKTAIDELSSYNITSIIAQKKNIRLGYVIYPPSCMNDDSNSEKPFGIGPEILDLIEQKLNIKFDWVKQVSWGNMIKGLNDNEYDMIGTLMWETFERSTLASFSTPIFFSPINVYSRTELKNKLTFEKCKVKYNNAKFTIGVIPGEVSDTITKSYFPLAKKVELDENAKNFDIVKKFKNKEIDLCFLEPYIAQNSELEMYTLNKTDSSLLLDDRILFPNSFMLRQKDIAFTKKLNIAINELIREGEIDKILREHYGELVKQYRY